MNVLTFNGVPKKKWNTATLLRKALDGAASWGASTEPGARLTREAGCEQEL